MEKNIKFGFQEDGNVRLYTLCKDPDGSDLQWFNQTDTIELLEGREKIGEQTVEYKGRCIDTAEYTSNLGELAHELVTSAPEGTTLVALVCGSEVRTRTFLERLTGHYYK